MQRGTEDVTRRGPVRTPTMNVAWDGVDGPGRQTALVFAVAFVALSGGLIYWQVRAASATRGLPGSLATPLARSTCQ